MRIDLTTVAADATELDKLLNVVLLDAVRRRATEIRFDPIEESSGRGLRVLVHLQVDGTLIWGPITIPGPYGTALMRKLRAISGISDQSATQRPQGGLVAVLTAGGTIDFASNISVTPCGESCILRRDAVPAADQDKFIQSFLNTLPEKFSDRAVDDVGYAGKDAADSSLRDIDMRIFEWAQRDGTSRATDICREFLRSYWSAAHFAHLPTVEALLEVCEALPPGSSLIDSDCPIGPLWGLFRSRRVDLPGEMRDRIRNILNRLQANLVAEAARDDCGDVSDETDFTMPINLAHERIRARRRRIKSLQEDLAPTADQIPYEPPPP